MAKPRIHFEVLDSKRRAMLPRLQFLRDDYGCYLAGGTALALQIRHRTSLDFDFYSGKEFDNAQVLASFQRSFDSCTLVQNPPNTLIVKLGEVDASVFYYPYRLLKPVVRLEHLDLASQQDIAAMKLIAIIQRGNMRDFIDLYFLLNEFPLEKIFQWTKAKFPPFNPYLALRALSYFQDAERDPEKRRFSLLKKVGLDQVKHGMEGQVKRFIERALSQ